MKTEPYKIHLKYLLLLLIIYLLQSSVFPHLKILGVKPLLLPLFAVGVGLFRGGLAGGCWGLAAGLLCDISLGGTGLLFTVFLTACGFFTGFLSQFVLAKGFPSYFVISLSVLMIAAFIQMFGLLAYYGADPLILILTGLKQTLYSLILTVPIYLWIRRASQQRSKV